MPLSPELAEFCDKWLEKAAQYDDEIHGAFDKFFTLYVVFNRLYAEATFRLARRGQIKLKDRFPDARASQEYVLQFCGSSRLVEAWDHNPRTKDALQELSDHLRGHRFYLKLDMVTGDRRPDADDDLLKRIESRSANRRAQAGLEALYTIRCNMFHGHKGFDPIQMDLLQPALVLLEGTIGLLRQVLEEDGV